MKLGRSLELFLTAKRGELVSEKTVAYYEYWTKDFFRYAVTVQGAYDWDSIRAEHIQSYLAMLGTERKVRSATVPDAYRAVKALNRWLFKQSYIPSCVIDKVQAPKQEKIIPRTFTIKEIQAMYGACSKTSFAGVRDRTMLTLLLSSGIRKSELAGILSEDVDLEQGHIKVMTSTYLNTIIFRELQNPSTPKDIFFLLMKERLYPYSKEATVQQLIDIIYNESEKICDLMPDENESDTPQQ